jgi:hypothetical protein
MKCGSAALFAPWLPRLCGWKFYKIAYPFFSHRLGQPVEDPAMRGSRTSRPEGGTTPRPGGHVGRLWTIRADIIGPTLGDMPGGDHSFVIIASPSSSQVQDTGLSRLRHRFKSGWGRQLCYQKALALSPGAFLIFGYRREIFGRNLVGVDCYGADELGCHKGRRVPKIVHFGQNFPLPRPSIAYRILKFDRLQKRPISKCKLDDAGVKILLPQHPAYSVDSSYHRPRYPLGLADLLEIHQFRTDTKHEVHFSCHHVQKTKGRIL